MNSTRIQTGLKKSKFRSRFHLDAKDCTYISQRGFPLIHSHALDMVRKRLAPPHPEKDGKQTPFRGHPVFKAQHATATCCRGCLKKWYRIEKDVELSQKQIEDIAGVIMDWITERYEGDVKHGPV